MKPSDTPSTIQVDDFLLENISAALSDRQSTAKVAQISLLDDLQLSRGKAEQLEAQLRRHAAENEVCVPWESLAV